MATQKPIRKQEPGVPELFSGIRQGDRNMLSRAITLVESEKKEKKELSLELIEKCLPLSGNSLRIGITGVPGAGKSTFINAFGSYLTKQGKKVAVLAVDPSSSITKGSILGDKTRMIELSSDPNAFIRPSPSSGTLGGVTRTTGESIILCEAAGYDVILIETVGVGQSETLVHSLVDYFLLIMIAGAGDELQGIKRGIMEMADGIAINKADGDNVVKAKAAAAEFKHALHLFPPSETGHIPTVDICSSLTGSGLENIWNNISQFQEHGIISGHLKKQRQKREVKRMYDLITENLKEIFFSDEQIKKLLPEYLAQIEKGKISPYKAAADLPEIFKKSI
jgi:LAO/AO transport system kinase